LLDEIKHFDVALRIPNHSVEVFELKKADISVVILNRFLLDLGNVLGGETKFLIVSPVEDLMLFELRDIMLEQ
jgi:hypothetical protein